MSPRSPTCPPRGPSPISACRLPSIDALAGEGITTPFAIQRDVIGDVLNGRDVLVKSPTGSGKTLAFGIPLVDRTSADRARPTALILAPTRELATQIVTQIGPLAHARKLRITAVYGGVGLTAQAKNAARSQLLVATPGRLEDLLARRAFKLDQIEMLVLDEADRMLDMGFRPAVDRILGQCPRVRQTLFFSATLDGEAGRLAQRYTRDAAMHEHGPTERRASQDVEHRFVEIAHTDRVEALVRELGQRPRAHAGVRAHQARSRPARQASRRPRHQGGGDARQQVSAPARAGPRPIRVAEPSTRWSPPTSPPAGSTSRTSRT